MRARFFDEEAIPDSFGENSAKVLLTTPINLHFNKDEDGLPQDAELTMSSLPGFLLRIAKATNPPEEGAGMMCIIIRRPYAHLEEELCRAFEGQEDVKVVMDSCYGERRTSQQPVAMGRRQADRRSPKEELVEVVISMKAIWSRPVDSNKAAKCKSFFFEKYSQSPIAV